jgi:hypothetical protein
VHIRSTRIRNYRSISDSGTLSFSPGFNLVVGANNVGKSSLLLCLAAKFGSEPHRSIHVLPTRDETVNPTSHVDLETIASGDEVRRLLLAAGSGERYFPWPNDLPLEDARAPEALIRLLDAKEIPFCVSVQAISSNAPNSCTPVEYPATRLYSPLRNAAHHAMLRIEVNQAARTVRPIGVTPNTSPQNDAGIMLGQLIAGRIYRFHAERLTLGIGPYGANSELASDARNLPEALNILQGNPQRFRDYCNFVQRVFPSIRWISVHPYPGGGNQLEVLVWQVDPEFQRDDLAMPLAQCGTGVGQVLAMLYVAKISEQPRTIIIDEPGSFLHPGASRALMGILKGFSHHQYIIASHSPEIIAELADAPVTIIRWEDSRSVMEQAPRTTGEVAGAALAEVGARLSDVFGFDKVLWVEGQSDAQALKSLMEAAGRPQRRVGILPVRDTGSFRRRKIAEVLAIYRALSMGQALLPPAVLFLFDRDGRLEHGIGTTEETVRRWLDKNGERFCNDKPIPGDFTKAWLKNVDGANLLHCLFQELSDGVIEYRKTSHTPRLTLLLHQVDSQAALEIIDLIVDVIE